MLRKMNFTERAKIPRSAVRIALRRETDGVLAFDPTLDLSGIAVASEARVYIEAHYRTSYMRFDCGTAGDLTMPENRRLAEIDSSNVVRFRVKIVDNTTNERRIVAAADDITVSAESNEDGARVSLLPVEFRDLGDVPWDVQFEASGPVLELNNRIDGIERLARNDATFFALVYPAAVREILTRILIVDAYEATDESDEWWSLWMRWARDLTDVALPEDPDDRSAWIGEVVAGFCGRHRLVEKMHPQSSEDGA
jgi:hypothetical protein